MHGKIEEVRNSLNEMGVDFTEVGYIGAIKVLGGVSNVDDYNNRVGSVKDDIINIMNQAEEKQKAVDTAQETYDELQKNGADEATLNSAKQEVENKKKTLTQFEDDFINFYIQKYLYVQQDTGAAVNGWTFSDNNGAIRVQPSVLLDPQSTLWERIWNWFTGSYEVKFEGGKFYTKVGNQNIDITKEVYQIYMPWQYPFAFHNETMSPDVGYLVSTLGRYHYIDIVADLEQALIITVNYDDEGNIKNGSARWMNNDELSCIPDPADVEKFGESLSDYLKDPWGWVENMSEKGIDVIARNPVVLINKACTWYSTYKYPYDYNGPCSDRLKYVWNKDEPKKSGFDESSKNAVQNCFNFSGKQVYYHSESGAYQNVTDLGFTKITKEDGTRSILL